MDRGIKLAVVAMGLCFALFVLVLGLGIAYQVFSHPGQESSTGE